MKRIILYLCLIQAALQTYAQNITVSSGTLSVGVATTLTLRETSLVNNGEFTGSNGSIVSTYDNMTIGGISTLQLYTLIAHGNIDLETDVQIDGNMVLNSGIFNLNNSNLMLNGQIIGENNSARIFTSGSGEIIKIVDLEANQKNTLGNIGLEITSLIDYTALEFRRGHAPQSKGSSYGIERYYSIPEIDESMSASLTYLTRELNNLDASNLKANVLSENSWIPVNTTPDPDRKGYLNTSILPGYQKITLFESAPVDDVIIPGGISPNNDSRNDVFVISGIENYPNNKLVIFNRWGDILIEKEPYENDWGGENENSTGVAHKNIFPDGTYFYIFFKDKNDKSSAIKGSIEIKRGN
jgi:gliding motility-associated-like protein